MSQMTWKRTRLRFVASLNPPISSSTRSDLKSERAFLPMEAIGENWRLDGSRSKIVSESLQGYSYFQDGDLLIAKVTPCFENGKAAVVQDLRTQDGFATTEVTVVRPSSDVDRRFLFYRLRAADFMALGRSEMTGAGGLRRVPDDVFRNFTFEVPPRTTQAEIANYLDRETAEIDAFISDQEELIILLEERRAQELALLFGPVAMPGAASSKFGRFVSEQDVRVKRSERQLLSVSIHRGVEPAGSGSEAAPPGYKLVRKGDIVLNRMRAFQGAVGYSGFDGGVSPDYAVLVVASGVDGRFVGELMRSRPFVSRMTSLLRGIGGQESGVVRTPRVNTRDLLSIDVNMPGLAGQRESVDRAHAIRASTESAIADAREAVALSKERRAALISAAVTGQIDVTEKKRVLI